MVSVHGNQTNNRVTASSSTSTNNKAEVKPITINNQVEATNNLAKYYSEISQDWAIGEGLIQNIDYSSKTYALQAKDSATEAKASLDEAKGYTSDAVEEIQNLEQVVLSNISMLEQSASSTVEQGIQNIGETVTEALTTLETTSDATIEEIKSVSDKIINRVSFELFDTKLSDHILTYEETKGWALQGTFVYKDAIAGERYGYPDFIAECIKQKNESEVIEVTLGENTITMYQHANGHKFYAISDKNAVDDWYNTYKIADFYGVDEENESVFLPRNDYFMQLTCDITKVNEMNEAGLPTITTDSQGAHTHARGTMNIKGGFYVWGVAYDTSGVFSAADVGVNTGTRYYESSAARTSVSFDASKNWTGSTSSNGAHTHTIEGNADTVQPPSSNKLLYYCVGTTVADTSWVDVVTQVEAGVKDLEEKRLEAITDIMNVDATLPMFSPVWSDHILNDVSYLRADTFSWHSGYIYKTAYEILLDEYNNENCVEETENGVTFKRTPSGFKIASAEQNDVILDVYNNTGIAWYYIIDVVNMQFKLPRTQWGFVGNRDGVGGQIEAGLPSVVHTHTFSATTSSNGAHTHSLTLGYAAGANWGRKGAKWGGDDVTDSNLVKATTTSNGAHTHTVSGTTGGASITSDIYGKSDTVQPPATQMYLYFYIGNYQRPATEIQTGKVFDVLANKADIDGGNYVGSGLQTILEKTTLGTQGGTLTGTLNIKQSNTLDYTDTNHTTVNETAGEIYFRDKNDEVTGYVLSNFNQYNYMVLSTSARRSINGTVKTAQTHLYVDANGNENFIFPKCTTKATTTSSATNDKVAVITQNYVSGTSWYRVWSDGWIEQGGTTGAISRGTKTTYLKSFTNTNYSLTTSLIGSTQRDSAPSMVKATNGFTIYHTAGLNNGLGWSWYACGY